EERDMEVVRLPFQEAVRRVAGPPGDAKTLVALGLYGLMRAGSWAPDQADRPPPDAPARRAANRASPGGPPLAHLRGARRWAGARERRRAWTLASRGSSRPTSTGSR